MIFKQRPNIEIVEDQLKDGFFLKCKGLEQFVSRNDLQKCWNELQITNSEIFFARFRDVCEWFIAQTQYVEFEEIKNTRCQ